MITLKGHADTFILTQTQGANGKFSGIFKGYRQEDQLAVSTKRLKHGNIDQHRIIEKLTAINHPALATTIELINHEDNHFVIRKYYPGTDLKTILNKASIYRRIKTSLFIEMAICILDGLSTLHQQGIIHRNIKPANIIIPHEKDEPPNLWNGNQALLINFEQASLLPCTNQRIPFSLVYSPPEQLLNRGRFTNQTSDLFALGITLYETIAGKPPYQDCNAEILLNLQLTYPVKKPPRMNEQFFNILAKATYKEPFPKPPGLLSANKIESIIAEGIQKRYQQADDMKEELRCYFKTLAPPKAIPWYKRMFR